MTMTLISPDWPPLSFPDWENTCDTLHMWTQIVGKTRMALAPLENHWWNVTLYVNNLTNKNVAANVFANDVYPIFSPVLATLRPPRLFGIRGQVNFGKR